jgi:putative alpha-1,2-mannosidase
VVTLGELAAMVFISSFLFAALLFGSSRIYPTVSLENPEDFVNPLAGTFTDGQSYSTGNTLPLIGRPWGFNHWAPQTTLQNHRSSSWWFSGNDHSLHWLRCTHQPSPWIGDWGWFLFMPQVGSYSDNPNFWYPFP